MENASKALLMAAGVLIGLLILSLAVYLFATFGASSAELHKQNEENQLNQFNSQFTSYEGKEGITIYDVITIANLATENNIKYEFPKKTPDGKDNYIRVTLNNVSIEYGLNTSQSDITKRYNEIIQNDVSNIQSGSTELQQYNCKTTISSITR